MILVHEDAWAVALSTLKEYANGKVPCKSRQMRAFAALAVIDAHHPGTLDDKVKKAAIAAKLKEEGSECKGKS